MTKSKFSAFSAFSPYYFHVFSTFSPHFFNSAFSPHFLRICYAEIRKKLRRKCGTPQRMRRSEVRAAAEEEEDLPDFLLPWKGRGRALPAPARKGDSCLTVLCVVDGGEPSLSNTEGLGAVFLDDVFVLVLTSFCLAKVTDEPVIRSACLMARTRAWRTFGSGPTTWWPSNGAVRTAERTGGWKLKFLRRASRRNNCRLDAAAKPAETWASWMMVKFSRRSLERSSLGENSSITEATIVSARDA